MDLLDEQDGADLDIAINEDFAAKYDYKKRREELSKLEGKYGTATVAANSDEDSESSTDYSSEDSDAELITPQVDVAILKIIGRIRKGDTSIYTSDMDFFDEEEKRLATASTKERPLLEGKKQKSRAIHLKEYQRNALLAGNGLDGDESLNGLPSSLQTPLEEADALRSETKAAFLNAVDGGDASGNEEDDLLVKREGRSDSDDDDIHRRFLLENIGEEEVERALALGRETENLNREFAAGEGRADDIFLKNYILNRGWLDKKAKHRPSYAEIVTDASTSKVLADDVTLNGVATLELEEDSEEEFEKAEQFETKYNFRFEEVAGQEIQTHGRDVLTSIRREDDSRKRGREYAKATKLLEKQERMEELKRLKNLKRQEIIDKISRVRETAGIAEEFDLNALDLEEEYDPESHDTKMAAVFNDSYYGDLQATGEGKPVWEEDIDISDIFPSDNNRTDVVYAPGGDAYDPTEPGPSGKKGKFERKKGKKMLKKARDREEPAVSGSVQRSSFEKGEFLHEDDKDTFNQIMNPEDRKRTVEQFMDDYYKLDYEDMIGDLPTRFHYTSSSIFNSAGTAADEYGLTPAEILMATDAELNSYESLRKIAPYRSQSGKDGKKRKKVKELRKIIASRRWGDEFPIEGETELLVKYPHLGGSSKKRKIEDEIPKQSDGESKEKKKRLGAKQRKKAKSRAEEEKKLAET